MTEKWQQARVLPLASTLRAGAANALIWVVAMPEFEATGISDRGTTYEQRKVMAAKVTNCLNNRGELSIVPADTLQLLPMVKTGCEILDRETWWKNVRQSSIEETTKIGKKFIS